jgi:hypothetical protein
MTATAAKPLTSYRKYWAQRFGTAPFLPMSRAEMEALGWDECDIILVTGDAYIDHPSFGMALVGRLLEAQGFRVGIISQPDWHSADDFKRLGKPAVLRHHRRQHGFDGQPLHVGPQDPLRRRLHAKRRARPPPRPRRDRVCAARPRSLSRGAAGDRQHRGQPAPHRALRLLERQGAALHPAALQGRPADLRQCRARAGGLAHRLAKGEKIDIRDLRGTAFMVPHGWLPGPEWTEADSTTVDTPGAVHAHPDPYAMEAEKQSARSRRWRHGDRAPCQPRRAPGAAQGGTRAHCHPPAVLRAGVRRPGALRPCLAHLPPRIESRQCARADPGAWRRG